MFLCLNLALCDKGLASKNKGDFLKKRKKEGQFTEAGFGFVHFNHSRHICLFVVYCVLADEAPPL